MYLYNLTLSRASGIQCAIYGSFSQKKAQEIVVSRGKVLELLRPDENGKVQTVMSTEVFGVIRSMCPFRLMGTDRDYVIVGSDSGRIVILQHSKERNCFVKVHQETFGRSGCRRIVPGQYVAVDPRGRACMIAATEKQKFVYVLNRDNQANLTISSPLEAHKSCNVVYHVVGLDCGFENPIFAAIELDYSEADNDPTGEAASMAQKTLTYYELDLGLNHVMRKWSSPIDNGANLLVAVPGGGDGPGGVLVCAENFVLYKHQDHPEVKAVIPRRANLAADRGVLIVAAAAHKLKSLFFFLAQSEYGDIYKITLEVEEEQVTELKIKYFDTIPTCHSICVLKTGFLFAASECGNHALYQFQSIGDDTDDVESSSTTLVETEEGFQPVTFEPRPLHNLLLVDEPDSLAPIVDLVVENVLKEETPQIYALCGRGPRSTLRVLRPGLAVTEMAVSPLPGQPTSVWTIRRSMTDEFDAYIVVSFTNATLVLSIGETVEEVNDSGFLGTTPTLTVQLLADSSLLQVHPGGIRHIRTDKRIQEWRAPGRRSIHRACTNTHQVIIALDRGELIYFELDAMGNLLEVEKKDLESDVSAMDIAPVPDGLQRCRWLAVGCYDSTVRVLSLNPDDCMKTCAMQAVKGSPDSLLLLESTAADAEDGADAAPVGGLFLNVGLSNGILMRTEIDRVTGKLSDARQRFLGTRSVKLFGVNVRGQRSMLALSSRPWLGYSDQGRYSLAPLSYEALDFASGFASDQCPEGFVAVAQSTLRVIMLERLGETFNQQVTRLRYTPRRMVLHPETKLFIIGEADHGTLPLSQRTDLVGMEVDGNEIREVDGPEFDEQQAALEEQLGPARGAPGQWASCLRVLDPSNLSSTHVVELDNNEAVTSMCLAPFASRPEDGHLLCVGTAEGMTWYPREAQGGFIRLYRFVDGGGKLELVHSTPVEGVPVALAAFQGRLLAGVGNTLKLFDAGKKKMLRKCEYRALPNLVVSINTSGDRIYVGDIQESFFFMKYRRQENLLYVYADDLTPRYLTAAMNIDYDTMCGADKFGNLFVARLPSATSAEVEEDPTGGKFAQQMSQLNGAAHKLESIIQFHVGDIVTALQRATFQPGGQEMIVYATIMGGIGVLLPFTSRPDVDFFQHLEMHLRQEHPPLCGRDHMAFRSFYFPVKDVVDGDLCEQFSAVPPGKQKEIASDLDKAPSEVLKMLEMRRNKVL